MKRCSVKTYEGDKGFIFISYSHRDKKFVFPIIEQMAYDGYRIWYDEGIDPGSEWPEIIAGHLNDCSVCMAFITDNYLKSHNCRRELNFALMKKKPFISVILEPVVMSPGVEMQLSVTQSVFKYILPSEAEFYSKLYEARFLFDCLGEPDHRVTLSKPEEYDESWSDGLFTGADHVKASFSDPKLVNGAQDNSVGGRELLSVPGMGKKPYPQPSPEPVIRNRTVTETSPEISPQPVIETQPEIRPQPAVSPQPEIRPQIQINARPDMIQRPAEAFAAVPEPVTVSETAPPAPARPEPARPRAWLLRPKTNETIELGNNELKLGRSASMADYVISGNSIIGRLHARVTHDGDRYCIIDNHSKNRTFLNSCPLEPDREYELTDGDDILLANERFEFHKEEP